MFSSSTNTILVLHLLPFNSYRCRYVVSYYILCIREEPKSREHDRPIDESPEGLKLPFDHIIVTSECCEVDVRDDGCGLARVSAALLVREELEAGQAVALAHASVQAPRKEPAALAKVCRDDGELVPLVLLRVEEKEVHKRHAELLVLLFCLDHHLATISRRSKYWPQKCATVPVPPHCSYRHFPHWRKSRRVSISSWIRP